MSYCKSILHVDDDPQMTRLVAEFLRRKGYEVTSLNDPTQVLRALSHSDYRVVLLDIDMPQLGGLELLRRIKRNYGGSQVIMLTGLVTVSNLLQSYRWGAEFCIFKPLTDFAPLLSAIETVFRKIDHWWVALEELSKQRHVFEGRGVHPVAATLGPPAPSPAFPPT